jgi:glycosyltransferase involved in cell wall biosynthesis
MPGLKVTICIPTVGRLTYLNDTLRSLEWQTLQDYEVLILDSDSPPDAAAKLREIAELDPRRRIVRSGRIPMFANFNLGIREARGQFVTFFHDDDVYEPDFLEKSVAFLETHRTAGFSGSNYTIIDNVGRTAGNRRLIKKTGLQPGTQFIRNIFRTGRNVVPLSGVVFRREAFNPNGFDERLSMHFGDYVVLMEIAERWSVFLIKEPLIRLRLHGGNASNLPVSHSVDLLRQAFGRYLDEFRARWPHDQNLYLELTRSAKTAYKRMLVWGWLAASTDTESETCLRQLSELDSNSLVRILRFIGAVGLRPARRSAVVAPIVRHLGRSIS